MSMPGMKMPAQQTPKSRPAPTKKKAATAKPKVKPSQAAAPAQAEHQGHDMSDMPGMAMPTPDPGAENGQDMQSMPGMDMSTMAMDPSEGGHDHAAGLAATTPPPPDPGASQTRPPG